MRCPKCGIELNPHSERCPRCGTSAKLAKPDGDTMTRVRRQIAVVRRQTPASDEDYADASFSPVMKFERPDDAAGDVIDDNPADNFEEQAFSPVDIDELLRQKEETEADVRHREIAAQIHSMIHHKEDDLLAAYYFEDGISDLEKIRMAQRDAEEEPVPILMQTAAPSEAVRRQDTSKRIAEESVARPPEEEMSEAARRLNTFPEESGIDKVLTFLGEKYDGMILAIKRFWERVILVRIKRVYHAFDKKTSPFLDKPLDWFYGSRWGGLKRSHADQDERKRLARLKIWSACAVMLVLLVISGIFIASLFSKGITGQWIISRDVSGKPNVMMEFTPTGSAVVSVRSEDGWHVHKQGQYKTQRKNGHDMLTIMYEDGTVTRLYYIIEGRSGTFINVETNIEVVYELK